MAPHYRMQLIRFAKYSLLLQTKNTILVIGAVIIMTDLFLVRLYYTTDLISYIYIPYNLLLCSFLIPFNTFIPMSTTSVVHGYLIVLDAKKTQ